MALVGGVTRRIPPRLNGVRRQALSRGVGVSYTGVLEDLFDRPPDEVAVRCADGVRAALAAR